MKKLVLLAVIGLVLLAASVVQAQEPQQDPSERLVGVIGELEEAVTGLTESIGVQTSAFQESTAMQVEVLGVVRQLADPPDTPLPPLRNPAGISINMGWGQSLLILVSFLLLFFLWWFRKPISRKILGINTAEGQAEKLGAEQPAAILPPPQAATVAEPSDEPAETRVRGASIVGKSSPAWQGPVDLDDFPALAQPLTPDQIAAFDLMEAVIPPYGAWNGLRYDPESEKFFFETVIPGTSVLVDKATRTVRYEKVTGNRLVDIGGLPAETTREFLEPLAGEIERQAVPFDLGDGGDTPYYPEPVRPLSEPQAPQADVPPLFDPDDLGREESPIVDLTDEDGWEPALGPIEPLPDDEPDLAVPSRVSPVRAVEPLIDEPAAQVEKPDLVADTKGLDAMVNGEQESELEGEDLEATPEPVPEEPIDPGQADREDNGGYPAGKGGKT